MRSNKTQSHLRFALTALALLAFNACVWAEDAEAIDFQRARQLFEKSKRGEALTADEQSYLDRAKKEMQKRQGAQGAQAGANAPAPKPSTGMVPLTELGSEKYKGEDGGLYGNGQNEPPEAHAAAAKAELAKIAPLDAAGKPDPNGRIVFVSISMSNATMEFSTFKKIADADDSKSPKLTIVDCAQGGQAMAEWAPPDAKTWETAEQRIKQAQVTDNQIQIAWVKLANKMPRGDLNEHGKQLAADTLKVLQNAKNRFPNLRIVYLSSRIYGGYATSALNPEPYAYEGAFAARWLIKDQIDGKLELNFNAAKGDVKAPLLLWGPYLWADGVAPRKSDGLVWKAEDFGADGTHPSDIGRKKVADLLLNFVKNSPYAKSWFCK